MTLTATGLIPVKTQLMNGEWTTLGYIDSYEQLTIDWSPLPPGPVGSLEEAQEIFKWYNENNLKDTFSYHNPPPNWEYIGNGSSRVAFRSDVTGAVYKILRWEDDNYNVQEHANFEYLRKSGKIPLGWSVPNSTLYRFHTMIVKPDVDFWRSEKYTETPGVATVIALEHIDGEPINYDDNGVTRARMYNGLESMGLIDGARGNVLRTKDGFCVVDAGEGFLDPADEVRFSKMIVDNN